MSWILHQCFLMWPAGISWLLLLFPAQAWGGQHMSRSWDHNKTIMLKVSTLCVLQAENRASSVVLQYFCYPWYFLCLFPKPLKDKKLHYQMTEVKDWRSHHADWDLSAQLRQLLPVVTRNMFPCTYLKQKPAHKHPVEWAERELKQLLKAAATAGNFTACRAKAWRKHLCMLL